VTWNIGGGEVRLIVRIKVEKQGEDEKEKGEVIFFKSNKVWIWSSWSHSWNPLIEIHIDIERL
jgi:hypothetical protein